VIQNYLVVNVVENKFICENTQFPFRCCTEPVFRAMLSVWKS